MRAAATRTMCPTPRTSTTTLPSSTDEPRTRTEPSSSAHLGTPRTPLGLLGVAAKAAMPATNPDGRVHERQAETHLGAAARVDSTLVASQLQHPAGHGSPVPDRRGQRRTDKSRRISPPPVRPRSPPEAINTVGDNPERLASEAYFAALFGVSPVERSSGRSGHSRRRTAGRAGHKAVRQCRSRVDEESARCQPVQARLSAGSFEAIRQ
ncbi:transposase [Streptomyces sp. NPDC008222]|uniref:transposase n=1 Tax=Streptomyces sp. NPDC008222 TaxID=3364820 RepID=UPI0036F12370